MADQIYFDITDIVGYAWGNDRVSGIQRVQLNLIGHLVSKHGGEAVRCVFFHPTLQQMFELNPEALFDGREFDATILLQQLGVEPPRVFFPPRRAIKGYLRQYSGNKLVRAVKKVDVYVAALMWPARLARMGLSRQKRPVKALPLQAIEHLPQGAPYVVLSANVAVRAVLLFAREHVRRGGVLYQLVYDVIAYKHPEYFTPGMVKDYCKWLNEVLEQAPRVIAISECTASDLRNILGDRSADWTIQAIPLSHEFFGFPRGADVKLAAREEEAALPTSPYVLCVGTLEIRKNGLSLLKAWLEVIEVLGDAAPRLVFAGKRGWLLEGFMELLTGSPALERAVQIVESPSDAQLAWMYRNCLFTVYPSLYEGWGLPVGESAWFGKYCIASRTSSIPEVCGDLIDYVDPGDAHELAGQIVRALVNPDYVREREQRIAQAKLRRWSDVADDIYRLARQAQPAVRGADALMS